MLQRGVAMIDIKSKRNCCGCHACAQICPRQCITMKPDEEGFLYPQIDETSCIHCNLCDRVCPILHVASENKEKRPAAYAAINKNEDVRAKSSSGGIFTLLAEYILAQNGIVFGAAMSADQYSVHHIAIETPEGLEVLRGSKYLQSTIGDTYKQAKKTLQKGYKVLFTGTPCQIEGLKSFLQGENYPNLYCMDLICHGVPSPLVWKAYVTEREKFAGAHVEKVFFRYKKNGWKTYALLFEFCNNKAYESILPKDPFMQAFLQNACLRPSCHSCQFKKLNRVSDITVADYWGIQNQYPDMDDDKGTSLVLVHSAKGKELFEAVAQQMKFKEVSPRQALRENPAMTSSAIPHRLRKLFFKNIGVLPFKKLVQRYARPSFSWRKSAVKILEFLKIKELVRSLFKRTRK